MKQLETSWYTGRSFCVQPRVEPSSVLWKFLRFIFIAINVIGTIGVMFMLYNLYRIPIKSDPKSDEFKAAKSAAIIIILLYTAYWIWRITLVYYGICQLSIDSLQTYAVLLIIFILIQIISFILGKRRPYKSYDFSAGNFTFPFAGGYEEIIFFVDLFHLLLTYYLIDKLKDTNPPGLS